MIFTLIPRQEYGIKGIRYIKIRTYFPECSDCFIFFIFRYSFFIVSSVVFMILATPSSLLGDHALNHILATDFNGIVQVI